MPLAVDVSKRTQGDSQISSVVRLTGELDQDTSAIADRETKNVFNEPCRVVVFDLAGLTFVTSAGVAWLLASRRTLEMRGASVYFSSPRPAIRRVLEIMKALPMSSVFTNEAELDAYLAEIQRKVSEGE